MIIFNCAESTWAVSGLLGPLGLLDRSVHLCLTQQSNQNWQPCVPPFIVSSRSLCRPCPEVAAPNLTNKLFHKRFMFYFISLFFSLTTAPSGSLIGIHTRFPERISNKTFGRSNSMRARVILSNIIELVSNRVKKKNKRNRESITRRIKTPM